MKCMKLYPAAAKTSGKAGMKTLGHTWQVTTEPTVGAFFHGASWTCRKAGSTTDKATNFTEGTSMPSSPADPRPELVLNTSLYRNHDKS